MYKFINLIIIIFFAAVILIFSAQNSIPVSIKFLGLQSIKLPISVVVFSAVVIGIIIALIYHFYAVYKLKKEFKSGHVGENNRQN